MDSANPLRHPRPSCPRTRSRSPTASTSSRTVACRSCRTSGSCSASEPRSSSTRGWARRAVHACSSMRARSPATDRLLLTLTHFHPEHGFGAQVFEDAALIVYNTAQRDELRQKGEAYVAMFRGFGESVAEQLVDVRLVDPHVTYDGPSAEIDLGGRTARLRDVGTRPHRRGTRSSSCRGSRSCSAATCSRRGCSRSCRYFPPGRHGRRRRPAGSRCSGR